MPRRRKAVEVLNRSLFNVVREFERVRGSIARDHGVTVTELRALTRIVEGREITPKLLAQQLELTTGAVTALTDRLVESGYVSREPNPDDRRSLLLAPTESGSRLMREVVEAYEAIVRQRTVEVDDERLEEFATLLDVLLPNGQATSAP